MAKKTDPSGSPMLGLEQRRQLYAARQFLPREAQKELGLYLRLASYFKDPKVAAEMPGLGIDDAFMAPWEPGLRCGPTSARFAVVDWDETTTTLTPPAQWDSRKNAFLDPEGKVVGAETSDTAQFRQVSTWARLQNTLDHFENGLGLGRRISWGFEGNRLIVVPQAGYGQNAYYDRQSKSLQFYYFDTEKGRVFTCLAADIVAHEFGHALLDGIRPYYLDAIAPETAAFHEFMGDLTAILMVFRNNSFRQAFLSLTAGKLDGQTVLSDLAPEFGAAVSGRDYLRSAANRRTMAQLPPDQEPHETSEVLTGAVFDIIRKLSEQYLARKDKKISVADALWLTIQRVQTMAIQALELLPPVEVSFRDFALAFLRAEFVANPTDPDGYRPMIADVFVARGILDPTERDELLQTAHVFERMPLTVFHDARRVALSRGAAYRFLDDNRQDLFIPGGLDLVVADVFVAEKLNRQGRKLPTQIVIQYVWREEVVLEGDRFRRLAGRTASIACGGTLVLDEDGNQVAWARNPGAEPCGTRPAARREAEDGAERRRRWLDALAMRIKAGQVGEAGGGLGLLEGGMPLLAVRETEGSLRFELTPHLSIGHSHEAEDGVPWHLSS